MNSLYRALYFRTFVLFFLILLPFLVFFTLGYDINLNKSSLSQSLLISIVTLPRNSKVVEGNKIVGKTPTEVRGQNNLPITLDITQNNYFPEKFTFLSNSNTVANISNLSLMPDKPAILSTNTTNEEIVSILSDRLILMKINNKYYTKSYTFGGVENTESLISNQDDLSLVNGNYIDIGGAYYFYESQSLLTQKSEKWIFFDLKKLPFKTNKIIKKNSIYLIQTDDSQLWYYDIESNLLKFIESNVFGISKVINSEFVWILKDSKIYRIDSLNDSSFQINTNQGYYNLDIFRKSNRAQNFFDIKNVFQGVAVKYGTDLIYIPDFDTSQSILISNSVESFEIAGSAIFWIDSKGDFYVNNLELKSESLLGQLPTENTPADNIKISYYSAWKRVFVYLKDQTYTSWFDKSVLNTSVLKYFPYSFSKGWCLAGVTEKNQFCIENNKLVSYRNTRIW
jgi:hypothetical protein